MRSEEKGRGALPSISFSMVNLTKLPTSASLGFLGHPPTRSYAGGGPVSCGLAWRRSAHVMSTDSICRSSLGVKYSVGWRSLWDVRPWMVRYSRMLAVTEAVELRLDEYQWAVCGGGVGDGLRVGAKGRVGVGIIVILSGVSWRSTAGVRIVCRVLCVHRHTSGSSPGTRST